MSQRVTFIRLKDVIKKTGLSRSSIYRKSKDGEMPPPCTLGENSVAWVESEINEWLEQKIAERDKQLISHK